jgi:hypothetical protein
LLVEGDKVHSIDFDSSPTDEPLSDTFGSSALAEVPPDTPVDPAIIKEIIAQGDKAVEIGGEGGSARLEVLKELASRNNLTMADLADNKPTESKVNTNQQQLAQQQAAEVSPEVQTWADNVTDPQAYLDNPDSIETMASMLGMDATQMTSALQNTISPVDKQPSKPQEPASTEQQVTEITPEAQSWADTVTDPQAYLENPSNIEAIASMLGMDAAQMTAALQNKVSQPEIAQTPQQTTQPVVEKSPQQRIEETIRDASTSPAEVLNDRSYVTTLSQQTGLSEKDVTKILKQMDKGGTPPKQEIQPNLPVPKTIPTKPAAKPVEMSNQDLKTPEGRHNAIDQVAGEFDKILPLNTQRALSFKKTTQEKIQALANLDTAIFDPIFKMGKGEEVFTHNEYLRRLEASYAGAVDSYPGDSPRDVQKRQAAVKESVEKSRQKILNEAVPGLRKLAEEGVNELNGEPIDLNQVADLYEKYANVLADALLEENGISTSGTAKPSAPQAITSSLKPSSLKSRKKVSSSIPARKRKQ